MRRAAFFASATDVFTQASRGGNGNGRGILRPNENFETSDETLCLMNNTGLLYGLTLEITTKCVNSTELVRAIILLFQLQLLHRTVRTQVPLESSTYFIPKNASIGRRVHIDSSLRGVRASERSPSPSDACLLTHHHRAGS